MSHLIHKKLQEWLDDVAIKGWADKAPAGLLFTVEDNNVVSSTSETTIISSSVYCPRPSRILVVKVSNFIQYGSASVGNRLKIKLYLNSVQQAEIWSERRDTTGSTLFTLPDLKCMLNNLTVGFHTIEVKGYLQATCVGTDVISSMQVIDFGKSVTPT